MKVAIVIAPNNFKDETLSNVELILDKKGIEHRLASFTSKACTGYHGAVRKPDVNADAIEISDFDALILVDGPGVDAYKLYDHRRFLDVINAFHESNKMIVGMGNTTKILARSNVIRDTKIAGVKDEEATRLITLYKGVLTDKNIVIDKNLMTAADSSDAVEITTKFAEALGVI